ncbi:hypothetical protein MMC26_005762 [Xylographa opegraphella]|nr:hypothetical protein [Xylographa opegraphella]
MMPAPSADDVALDVAREDYKKVADLAEHILRIWGCWIKRYEMAKGMLHRSLENVDFVVIDDVELEVREELNRRRLACEEAFAQLEKMYSQVEELRFQIADKVRAIMARISLALEADIKLALEEAAHDTEQG